MRGKFEFERSHWWLDDAWVFFFGWWRDIERQYRCHYFALNWQQR